MPNMGLDVYIYDLIIFTCKEFKEVIASKWQSQGSYPGLSDKLISISVLSKDHGLKVRIFW